MMNQIIKAAVLSVAVVLLLCIVPLSVSDASDSSDPIQTDDTAVASVTNSDGSVSMTFDTVAAAFDVATDGSTVRLLKDCASDTITFNQPYSITFDLGVHTLTFNLNESLVIQQGDVTIIGSSDSTGSGTIAQITSSASQYGTIMLNGSSDEVSAIYTHLTVGSGATVSGYIPVHIQEAGYGIQVDIDGTLVCNPSGIIGCALYINGNNDDVSQAPVFNLNDGSTITSGGNNGAYIAGYAILNIFDSTITADVGVEIRSGELHILGNPTITSTGTTASYVDNNSGATTAGTAISVVSYSTAPSVEVDIRGGTFTAPVPLYINDDDDTDAFIMDVSGGSFTVSPNATTGAGNGAIAPTVVSVANDAASGFIRGGTYSPVLESDSDLIDTKCTVNGGSVFVSDPTVQLKDANGNVVGSYLSLERAIEDAQDGYSVILLDDVSIIPKDNTSALGLSAMITIRNDITIDFGEHTLTWDKTPYDPSFSFSTYPLFFSISGDVTFTGTTGGFDCELESDASYGVNIVGGSLTVKGGVYKGGVTAIQVQTGTLVINGGTFGVSTSMATAHPDQFKYIISAIDANWKQWGTINIYGGNFAYDYGQDAENGGSYAAPGYTFTANSDGTYGATEVSDEDAIVRVDGKNFIDFTDAFEYATYVGKPAEIIETINVNGEITISDVTIQRGDSLNGVMLYVGSGGSLTLENVIIDGSYDSELVSNAYMISASGAEITITGSTLKGNDDTVIYAIGSSLTMTGSTVTGISTPMNMYSPIIVTNADVTISGCEFKDNHSGGMGAAMAIQATSKDVTANVTSTSFTGNEYIGNGVVWLYNTGGYYVTLNLDTVTFSDNSKVGSSSKAQDLLIDVPADFTERTIVTLAGKCGIGLMTVMPASSGVNAPGVFEVKEGFEPVSPVEISYKSTPSAGTMLVKGASATPEMFDFSYYSNMVLYNNGTGLVAQTSVDVTFEMWSGDSTVQVASGTVPTYPESDRDGFEITGWTTEDGSTWDITSTVSSDITLVPVWALSFATVSEIDWNESVNGSVMVLNPSIDAVFEGADVTYEWTDGYTGSSRSLTAPGDYSVKVTVVPTDGVASKELGTFTYTYDDSKYSVVTFVDGSAVLKTMYVPNGGSVSSADYPAVTDRIGYTHVWNDSDLVLTDITEDISVPLVWALEIPEASVTVSGTLYEGGSVTVTVTYTHPLSDVLDATFMYGTSSAQLGENGTGVFTISEAGNYVFVVQLTDSEGNFAGDVVELDIQYGEVPFVPIPDDDDDYVPIPPVVVDDSSSDDTVTVVACAAAAVVAALMAVFLIIERRK